MYEGLVPLLEDKDMILWESNTILRYLSRVYDHNNRYAFVYIYPYLYMSIHVY